MMTPEIAQNLKICSEISFVRYKKSYESQKTPFLIFCTKFFSFSYDTEALNKPTNNLDVSLIDIHHQFNSSFQSTKDEKTIFGVQQIYTIGKKS